MSAPPAPPVSSPPGDPQITELQRLLRKPRAAVPQWEHVVIALRLAEDPTLDPSVGSFWKDAGVPRGKARMTIKGYAARISSEGLLANASGAEHVAAPFHCIDGELMLTSQWINENAVNLKEFRAGPVVVSACGRYAARAIDAWNELCDEQVLGEIVYDLPPADGDGEVEWKHRRDMHRRREEAAVVTLAGAER